VRPIRSLLTRWRHYWLSRRLGSLGLYSRITRPEMIVGGERIFIGDRVRILPHARIECITGAPYNGTITIGEGTSAQLYFHCASAVSVTIGKRVLIAGRVYISDHDHAWPEGGSALVTAPVVVGDRCWLGEGCAILKGVTLGEGCVVGANAVVTRSAPPWSMLVGVPARIKARYDQPSGRWMPASEPEQLGG